MIDRLLLWAERRPGRCVAAVGLLFALAYASSLVLLAKPTGRIVIGDAVHYYVYLRSAVFDGDLHFRNEYVRIYGLRGGEEGTEWVYAPTATGHTRNLMSIGPAIAWAPLFLIAAGASWLLELAGAGPPPDGYGRLLQATTGLSGVLAATLGAFVAYRAAAYLTGARASIWATLVMWLGSSAIYYSLISPTYSHAISMLTVGLFVLVWLETRERQTIGRYALVGALGGIATLVRWQDAVLLIVPAIDALWHAFAPAAPASDVARHRTKDATADDAAAAAAGELRSGAIARTGVSHAIVCLLACGVAAVVAFLPQMIVWDVLYGSPFLVPQGDEFMRWTSPSLVDVLFSDWHGLLTWTPVVGVALIGLVMLARRDPLAGGALGAAFLVSWYANAAVADWWAGEAYGSRRFVSCFPIFTIGLAVVFQAIAQRQAGDAHGPRARKARRASATASPSGATAPSAVGVTMTEHAAPATGSAPRLAARAEQRGLRRLVAVATVIVFLNGLLLLQYQAFMHGLRDVVPYPKGAYELWLARFVVPFDLIRAWLQS